jgi:ankyrin repeat protein
MCFALYLLFKGRSALQIASLQNNVEAAKFLLLNGANVNAKDETVSISVC